VTLHNPGVSSAAVINTTCWNCNEWH